MLIAVADKPAQQEVFLLFSGIAYLSEVESVRTEGRLESSTVQNVSSPNVAPLVRVS